MQLFVLFPLGPQIASQSVAQEHKLLYFLQTIGVPGATEAAEPGARGEAAAWLHSACRAALPGCRQPCPQHRRSREQAAPR